MGKDINFFIREHPNWTPVTDIDITHFSDKISSILEFLLGKEEVEQAFNNYGRNYFYNITKSDIENTVIFCVKNGYYQWGGLLCFDLEEIEEGKNYIAEIMVF
jgi:hypothetical protein